MLKSKLTLLVAASVALATIAQAASRTPGAPTPLLTRPGEDKLIAILKSDAPIKDKADACRELAVLGTKDCVPTLAAMLPDEKLNHIARYALEPNPDPSVDEVLRTALGQTKGRPLVGVIHSIGVRRDAKATSALVKFLADADADVAQASARSLGKIGSAEAAKAIQSALPATAAANKLPFYEGLLRCAESLATQGQRGEAIAIYDSLRAVTEPHQVRAGGWRGAIVTRGKEGVALLAEALRSDDWIIVAAGARAALEMSGPEATPALTAELGKGSADKQILVIRTLGKRGDAGAQPALFAAAKAGETPIRVAATRAIAELGQSSAAAGLAALLGDAEKEVAQAAQDSLAALPGAETDGVVLAMLKAPEAARRITGLDLIARRRMTGSLDAVIKATGDTDGKVRSTAIKRLGELAGPADQGSILAMLIKANAGQELEAAEQALTTLSVRIGNPDGSAEKIAPALNQANAEQKGALLRVLSAVGGKTALASVRSAVKDTNPEVRDAAIRALGDWKTTDAAPDLLAVAKEATDAKVKLLCLRSYLGMARNTDFPADQRLAMCRDVKPLIQSKDEKRLLLSALGSVQTLPSLNLIAPYLDDETTKNEAGAATVAIADKLLKARDISKVAPKLIEPLQKVSQNTANADLAKRASALLKQAQAGVPKQ